MNKKIFYTLKDVRNILKKLSPPGRFPFRRAIHATMYTEKLWTMRQYSGFGTPEDTNRRFKELLKAGQTGLSVAFDLPTQIGYDPDDEHSLGEVGRNGVSIANINDFEKLFDGIPLDKVSVSFTINSTAAIILAMYIVTARRKGIKEAMLSGTLQNDMLKEFIARGTYAFDVDTSLKITTDIIEYCIKNMPKFNPISVSGYHMREAGCSAVQEVAFTLSNALVYLELAVKRGLEPDKVAERFSFFFGCHNNFFEEIAKFRAARELWATMLKEKYGIRNERALKLRFHTQTCGSTLVAQQPLNNIVRVTIQALASVLGGTQSLHTNSFDEAIALPTDESIKLALRTQQIIAYETGIKDVVDPLGGSFYIEYLTEKIKNDAIKIMKDIEKMGGMIEAVKNGWVQKQIEEESYKYQMDVENKNRIIVGLNEFVEEYRQPEVFELSYKLEKLRRKEIIEYRKKIDVKKELLQLKDANINGKNIIEYIIDIVDKGGTLGQIMNNLI